MGSLVIRNGVKLLGTLASGAGDNMLTIDASSKDITSVAAITPGPGALPSANLFVGDELDEPVAREITGAITISNLGVTSLAANVVSNVHVSSTAAIDSSKLATTYSNGITKTVNSVKLGGTISESTNLVLADTFGLTIGSLTGGGSLISLARDTGGISSFEVQVLNSSAAGVGLQLTDQLARFIDTRAGAAAVGLQYDSDLSANFTLRSLIDKGYADGAYWKVAGTSTLEAASILITQDNLLEISTDPLSATDPYIGIRFFPDTGFGYSAQFETRPLANVSTSFAHVNLEGNIVSLVSTTSTDSKQLTLSPTDAIFTDGSVNKKGVQYASSAYGAAFTDTTLIHRLYADGRYAPIGTSSSGANNEVQTSDGAGGFVASNLFFDESAGNMTLGDNSLSGSRILSVDSSDANSDITIQSKAAGKIILTSSDPTNNTVTIQIGTVDDLEEAEIITFADRILNIGNDNTNALVHARSIWDFENNTAFFGNGSFGSGTGVISISNASVNATAAPTGGIIIHSRDSSDSNGTLALYTEQAPEATGTFTQTHRLKVWINNVEYWISLDAV